MFRRENNEKNIKDYSCCFIDCHGFFHDGLVLVKFRRLSLRVLADNCFRKP